jgi:uridine phosphorylase
MTESKGGPSTPPILDNKHHSSASVFNPKALIREARRQKHLAEVRVPRLCVLDPDGDIARRLRREGRSRRFEGWPCYHTDMDAFDLGGEIAGIIGCAVGAPYAVLIAEELFACGCELLVSITSAGQIHPVGPTPYFIIIDEALRDEGTSYHYAPPSEFAKADPALVSMAHKAAALAQVQAHAGRSWTTDAPFRETAEAIEAARTKGVLAVEMEAAALYTFATVANKPIICFANVTNTMGQAGADFEKGEADGTSASLRLLEAIAQLV